jgi:hypothetical protein
MAVGYTVFLLDQETQQHLRAVHGFDHPGRAVATLRIIDRLNATRADKRAAPPQSVRIVGVHGNDVMKVLVAEVDGSLRRADGGFYHIPLFLPEAGLSPRVVDELVTALLSSVPEDRLYNKGTAESVAARPAFAVGVERPKAVVAPEAASQPRMQSRFIRVS